MPKIVPKKIVCQRLFLSHCLKWKEGPRIVLTPFRHFHFQLPLLNFFFPLPITSKCLFPQHKTISGTIMLNPSTKVSTSAGLMNISATTKRFEGRVGQAMSAIFKSQQMGLVLSSLKACPAKYNRIPDAFVIMEYGASWTLRVLVSKEWGGNSSTVL